MKFSASFTATTIGKSPNAFYQSSGLYASALIVQNKGGGHGELGFQIAKKLLQDHDDLIDSITILQDDACKDTQEPFKSYASDLPSVHVIKANLSDETMTASDLQTILGGSDVSFDYVWDNASKEPTGAGKACLDCAKSWLEKDTNKLQLYIYVSSAGIYQPTADTVFPMAEGTTPVKSSAGQVKFETCATELELPFVAFRPQYIYGEKANKFDYMYVMSDS
jgi:nucleoside-diphosphate-sugar epimerase